MASISASVVKALREKTGAGMMDCKKALVENAGDMEQATDWLRKKGLAAAAKKAGRVAAEGLVALAAEGGKGVVVEVNSETDFVARNAEFQALAKQLAPLALGGAEDVAAFAEAKMADGRSVEEARQAAVGSIGENIAVRRIKTLEVEPGYVASYVHGGVGEGLGKIGVLVALKSEASAEALAEIGKGVAMHVAAANPQAISPADLDPELVAREKAIYVDQAKASGKPDNIVDKIAEGRLRKFYEESTLLEQTYVVDTDKKVKEAVADAAKAAGSAIEVVGMVRLVLGEGVEKEESDLASEVAQLAGV